MAQREELLQDSVDKRRSLENCLPIPEAQEAGDRQNFQLPPKISTSAFFSFFGLCCCCFRCDHPPKEGNHTLNVPNWWLKESLELEGGRKQGDVKLGAAGVTLSVLWGEQCSASCLQQSLSSWSTRASAVFMFVRVLWASVAAPLWFC